MSLPPSTLMGRIDSSAGDFTRHFSLPSARLTATISLAPVRASVGRYSVSLSAATPSQPWRLRARMAQPHWGAKSSSKPTWERNLPVDVKVEVRSEEHTSEFQSREDLVCRLLLNKKKC